MKGKKIYPRIKSTTAYIILCFHEIKITLSIVDSIMLSFHLKVLYPALNYATIRALIAMHRWKKYCADDSISTTASLYSTEQATTNFI